MLFPISATQTSVMFLRSTSIIGLVKTGLALVALAGLGACASDQGGPITPHLGEGPSAAGALSAVYRLAIGDKLKVTVFGEKNLSGKFEVNGQGNIPLPLIGDVSAKGKSVDGFRKSVRARLVNGYLKNPKVSVEILNYRPFFVHGEVRQGGKFEFKNGLKLRDAIAMAGGYSYRAKRDFALLIREGAAAEIKIRLPTNLTVMPGDNIRIPERFF